MGTGENKAVVHAQNWNRDYKQINTIKTNGFLLEQPAAH